MEIPIPIDNFKNHFELEGNDRIIFSGRYGIGKTYFLDNFFSNNRINEKYYPVHLFPINYSLGSNEDIFKLIKYDILISLLSDSELDLKLEDVKIPLTLSATNVILDEGERKKLLNTLFSGIFKSSSRITDVVSDVQPSYAAVIKGVTSIIQNSVEEIKEQVTKNHDKLQIEESKIVFEFVKLIDDGAGLIYENDIITQIITKLISQIQERHKKEVVLIVDDLDRIEPEHIFRLFNVFSSHFDVYGKTNKYGFNKIIFVCDIENIRGTYYHKYGLEADFDGYIDKFFSREIYHFDNIDNVFSIVKKVISEMVIDGEQLKGSHMRANSKITSELESILKEAVYTSSINLRQLFNKVDYYLDREKYSFEGIHFTKMEAISLYVIDILKRVYGDTDILIKSLEKMQTRNKVNLNRGSVINRLNHVNKDKLRSLISFLDIENHKKNGGHHYYYLNNYNVNYFIENGDVRILKVKLNNRLTQKNGNTNFIENNQEGTEVDSINFIEFFVEGIKKAKKRGLLK